MSNTARLILASGSPRRKELLERLGLSFEVKVSHADEPPFITGSPAAYAEELALIKASAVGAEHQGDLAAGADTIVIIGNEVLGKPRNAAHAREMLSQLSAQDHTVITAFAFVCRDLGLSVSYHEKTKVHFRSLTDSEIDAYIATGSPFDKAGAYGIQDLSAVFVDRIEGCFYNVVGLPLSHFYARLKQIVEQHHLGGIDLPA